MTTDGLGPIAIKVRQDSGRGYINTTSTRECGFRAGFAGEYRRMWLNTGSQISGYQSLIG
jgi:hypothetical protein